MQTTLTANIFDHLEHSRQFYCLVTDLTGRIVYCNKLLTDQLDIVLLSRSSINDFLDEAGRKKCDHLFSNLIISDTAISTIELAMHGNDQLLINVSWELSPIVAQQKTGTLIRWIGVVANTTAVQTSSKADEDKERFEAYKHSAEGVWKFELREPVAINSPVTDIFNHCRSYAYLADCNENIAQMYGFDSASEMIGLSINELIDFDDPQRLANLEEFVRQGFQLTNVHSKEYDRKGRVRYFKNNLIGVVEHGMLKRIWGTQQDVTEQKEAEYRLQQSELFYRNLIADSIDGILLTDAHGNISFSSASVERILGFAPEELVGRNSFDFMHEEDRSVGLTAFLKEVTHTPTNKFISARIRKKSGEWLWCMIRGHNMLDNAHVKAMLIYFADDTLRMKAEMALIEGDKRFRQLINNINLGVILLDEKGEMLICNQACFDIFRLEGDTLTGTNLFTHEWSVTYENGRQMPRDEYPAAVALRSNKKVKDVTICVYPSRSDMTWLLVNAEPISDESGTLRYVICTFQDITEQKKLSHRLIEQEVQKQKQLVKAAIDAQENERKEIGRELHDNISQHITTTRLYLEVAMEKAEGDVLSMITLAHKGLQNTVVEIRRLSQSLVPPSLSDIGLVESIEDLCTPLKTTHAFEIEFVHDHFEEARLTDNMKLMIFRIIQEQVNNIIRHAAAKAISITLNTDSDQITLCISDNGKGFDTATAKRGLGFSNISNRAGLFSGRMQLHSLPGHGCSIKVEIPLPPQSHAHG